MDLETAMGIIDNLEKENNRLRMENKNTIKMRVSFGDVIYEVDTQIEDELQEGKYYWLADEEQTRVKFVGYHVSMSVLNKVNLLARTVDDNGEWADFHVNSLFKTKDKARTHHTDINFGTQGDLTARKMFRKLGFKTYENDKEIIIDGDLMTIRICLLTKSVSIKDKDYGSVGRGYDELGKLPRMANLSVDLMAALSKQMEEVKNK